MPFSLSEMRPVGGMPRSASICVAAAMLCCAVSLPVFTAAAAQSVGLGKLLTTKDGGQIYGFDIDQNGNDGVLASSGFQGNTFVVSVETFDQDTGKITKSFVTRNSARNWSGKSTKSFRKTEPGRSFSTRATRPACSPR